MFTQQHYIEIAKVLGKSLGLWTHSEGTRVRSQIVLNFIELFRENPKFDKEKFLDAIYGKEGK